MENSSLSPEAGPKRPPPQRRRDKPQLSCNACRTRKSKCDRQLPCGTCTKRGIASSCYYPPTKPSSKSRAPRQAVDGETRGLRKRLSNLESQILALMESGATQGCSSLPDGAGHEANVPESAISIPNQTQQGPRLNLEAGSLNTSASASSYVSGAHWVAILDSISELKEQVQSEDEDISKDHEDPLIKAEDHKPSLLFGYQCNLSKEDLIATLPARPIVDRWVSEYFNDLDMMPHISCLHTGTFSREYENLWTNPSSVSPIWLGLLYSMICLSARFGSTSSPTESGDSWGGATSSSGPLYLEQIVQCLVLGDYSQGGPYVIETLLHYFMIEHLRRPDTEVNTWLLLGVILRLGLRMGYHRDPSQFPNLTPFQREMRRRVWATLYVADVWQSIQIGAPRMFQDGQWDTRDPLNLVDTDFDETSSELPPSRDNGEVTHIFFVIARFKLAKVMGAISDIVNAIEPDPSKAAKAQKMLQETYDSLHPILKFVPGRSTLNEHPRTVLHQFLLAVSLHQAQVLLHQRYLTMSPEGNDPNGPLDVLINAALKILEYQNLMDLEIQPGGSLWTVRWKMSSTLAHEFLLATTVLSKVLFSTLGPHPLIQPGTDMDVRIRSTLRQTLEIWNRSKHRSKEAKQAANLLTSLFHALDSSPTNLQSVDEDSLMIDLESYLGISLDSLLPGPFLE